MYQYYDTEDEVILRLSGISEVVVVPLPENEVEMKSIINTAINDSKTAVIVAYTGSDFGPTRSTNPVQQDEDVKMLVNVQSNKLRGVSGIYYAISLIKQKLQGYQVKDGGRLKLKSIDFDDRDDKLAMFSYNIIFTFSKLQIQALADGDDDTSNKPNLLTTDFQTEYVGH